MGKRKRNRPDPKEYGIGATLAFLKEQNFSKSPRPLEDDDEDDGGGWITVGQPRKKQHRQQEPESRRSDRSDSDARSRDAPTEPKHGSSEDRGNLPSKSSSRALNPFSTSKNENTDDRTGDTPGTGGNSLSTSRDSDKRNNSHRRDSQSKHNGSKRRNSDKHSRDDRSYPAIEHASHARLNSQTTISNLQGLILYILADGPAPQWVSVRSRNSIRQVVVLLVPGLELGMFNGGTKLESSTAELDGSSAGQTPDQTPVEDERTQNQTKQKALRIHPDDYYPASLKPDRLPAALKPLSDIFRHVWPIKGAADSSGNQFHRIHSPIHSMLTAPIPKSREEKQMKKDPKHKGPTPQNTKNYSSRRTAITTFLADLNEQQDNEFVIHPAWFTTPEAKEVANQSRVAAQQSAAFGWVDSNVARLEDGEVPDSEIEQGSVTAGRHVFTVDCEMCKAEDDTSVLTRVSLLDWDGNVVMDDLVKPDVPIKDYLTQYSGITEAMLENVTTTLADVQKKLLEIIAPRAILAGHSLNSDLNALKFTHPFLVDTGIIYPHQRGPPYKQSLRWLSQKYLHKEIQKGAKGHDSVEDARACLDLVKQKCEHGPQWGTSEMNAESIFKRLGRATRASKDSGDQERRSGAVVDWGEPNRGHGGQAVVAVGCESDQDVVNGIKLTVEGHSVGKDGMTEKVDFVWGRLRELELMRGWWDDAKTADVQLIRANALKRLGRSATEEDEEPEVTGSELGDAVARTVAHIAQVYESLAPRTAFIVYSGTSDPREVRRLQAMRQQYQREYQTKNWDNLSVKWTDTEVQALSQACKSAREGIGFVAVK